MDGVVSGWAECRRHIPTGQTLDLRLGSEIFKKYNHRDPVQIPLALNVRNPHKSQYDFSHRN